MWNIDFYIPHLCTFMLIDAFIVNFVYNKTKFYLEILQTLGMEKMLFVGFAYSKEMS